MRYDQLEAEEQGAVDAALIAQNEYETAKTTRDAALDNAVEALVFGGRLSYRQVAELLEVPVNFVGRRVRKLAGRDEP